MTLMGVFFVPLPLPAPETASSFDYLGSEVGLTAVLLAAVAVLIAILALPVFVYLRHRAAAEARRVATEALAEMTANIEKQAIARIETMLPGLVSDYMALLQGPVNDSTANQIASAETEVDGDANNRGDPPLSD
jgi:UPF0716 family protein affecting phage T7 exclusion